MHAAGLLFLAASAFVVTSVDVNASAPSCKPIENMDLLGFDLSSAKGQRSSCDEKCAKTTGCQAWTWNEYQGGTCWLKSRAGKLVSKTGVWAANCAVDQPSLVCNAYKDIDFIGKDIGEKPGASFADCCNICDAFPGCTAYAWSGYNGGTCWLKESVGHVIANPGVISSSTIQLWGPVCAFEYDVDFVGNDIGNKRTKDAGECCDVCKKTDTCGAYTWTNWNGGTCWMKSAQNETVPSTGSISASLARFY